MSLRVLQIAAKKQHTATVIFAHGLGDTGAGWEPVARMLGNQPGLQHVKWILPHAPRMPLTLNRGMSMPGWFDIYNLELDNSQEDEKGMLKTVHSLNELITAEVDAGIDANRIVIGGFSQGGAMSLLTGLTTERKLGGVVVLSGWLPLRQKFKAMMNDHAKKIPIFWGHGNADPVVQYKYATLSKQYMKDSLGIGEPKEGELAGVELHTYSGMGHSAGQEELDDLQNWLQKVVPST